VGKAVLAYLEKEKFSEVIEKLRTIPEFKGREQEFMRMLSEVRSNGFAVADKELLRGIRAIAVPVFSPTGVVCAINIVGESEEVFH